MSEPARSDVAAPAIRRVVALAVVSALLIGASVAVVSLPTRNPALAVVALLALVAMGAVAALSVRSLRALATAGEAAATREQALDGIVRNVRELLFRTDARGVVEFVNPQGEAALGLRGGGLVGRKLAEVVTADSRAAVAALFRHDAGVEARQALARVGTSAGAARSFEFTAVPQYDGAALVGFVGSGVDLTELVDAQARLRAQLAVGSALIDGNPLPIAVLDLARHFVRVNRAWEAFTGRDGAGLVGQPLAAQLPPEQAALHAARDAELLHPGDEVRYEAALPHHDGTRREVFICKSLVPGTDGRPGGVVMVLMDVSEFREAERVTRRARDAAEHASRTQAEFVANISHELRTPLQSILGFAELGRLRGREQPKLAGMFDSIYGAGQRMLALVNDLLDLSKLESSAGTMSLERHDLRDLVRDVAAEIAPLLTPRHLTLSFDFPRQALVAKVDAARFQQVVRNVLANAIRFSPADGRIEIGGEVSADGDVVLAIADRGPGIPPTELEAIFDAFVQSSKTKDGAGGTGLGLAISRKIMRGHDGDIRAVNREGGGSVFLIRLPAARFGDTAPAAL